MTEKKTEEQPKFDIGGAQRLVEEERNARAGACLMRIMEFVEERRCRVEAVAYLTVEGRVLARWQVVAV